MSIFRCTQCGCVENTALAHYWSRVHMDGLPPVCSECHPDIKKWHGEFEKVTPESCGYVTGPDGFLYSPDDEYLKRLLAEKAENDKKAAK